MVEESNPAQHNVYESNIKSSAHGTEFKKEIELALLLGAWNTIPKFRLAYEVTKADKFADVVLIDDGRKEVHFVQVKHADPTDGKVKLIDVEALFPTQKPNIKSKGDYDLFRYIDSYLTINRRFQDEENQKPYTKKFYILSNKDLQNTAKTKQNINVRNDPADSTIEQKNANQKDLNVNITEDQKTVENKSDLEAIQPQAESLLSKDKSINQSNKFDEWVTFEETPVNEIFYFPESNARHLKLHPTEKAIKELGDNLNKTFIEIKTAIEMLFTRGKVDDILIDYYSPLQDVLKVEEKKKKGRTHFTFRDTFNSESKQYSVAKLYMLLDKELFKKQVTVKIEWPEDEPKFKVLPPYMTREELIHFFHNFTLSVNQPNNLRESIDSELQKWMKTWVRPDQLGKLNKKDMDQVFVSITKKYYGCSLPDSEGKKSAVQESDVSDQLTDIKNSDIENLTVKVLQQIYLSRSVTYKQPATEPNLQNTADSQIRDTEIVEELREKFKHDQQLLFVADPGMGKTNFLQFIAFEKQKKNEPEHSVFLVYFIDLVEKLEQAENITNLEDVVEILGAVLSEENCDIIRNAPGTFEENGWSVTLFLDGFDEIHGKYTKKAFQMLELLKFKQSIQVLISTRMHIKILLETTLKVGSMFLGPLSKEEKINYLRRKWLVAEDDESSFVSFSEQLLDKFHSSLPSNLCEVTGLPLMMKVLAETYLDAFTNQCKTQPIDLSKVELNIVQLYNQFLRKCFRDKFEVKYEPQADFDDSAMDSLMNLYMLEHMLLAMELLNIKLLEDLFQNPLKKEALRNFKSRCENDSDNSLLVTVVSKKVQFFHRSYSEYIVTKYICDHICTLPAERVISALSEHEIIRKMSMIKLEENESYLEILTELGKINWKIFLWACERDFLRITSASAWDGICKSLSTDNLSQMLQVAAKNGNVEICKLLLQNGADPDGAGENQWTALHMAAQNGHDQVVMVLMGNGVNTKSQTVDGKTPLDIASLNGHHGIVKLLEENNHGGDTQRVT